MKRIASVLLVLLLAALPFAALAESGSLETPDGFLYTLDESGDATITGYTGAEPDLVIPGEVDGHAVVAVDLGGLRKAEFLVSLTFPDSVKTIDPAMALQWPNLVRLTLPNGITALGSQLFADLTALTEVVIPESVKSIGNLVFSGCTSLTSVEIPASVTEIGINPFDSCSSLSKIIVAPGNENFEIRDRALFSKADNNLICYPAGLKAEEYAVPEGTANIGYCAFRNCHNLNSVILPEGLISIDISAFSNCENLANINLPEGLVYLGSDAFGYCTSLAQIALPQSLVGVLFNPFTGCTSLTDLTVAPDNTAFEVVDDALIAKASGELIFYFGNQVAEYAVPKGVTQIGWSAFAYHDRLTSITIPGGVTVISSSAFMDCANLESVVIPKSVTDISDGAFEGCDQLVLTVEQGSYAEWFAKRQELPFVYAE